MEELLKNKNVVKLGSRYFLDKNKSMNFCREKKIKPFSVGIFIGEEKNRRFTPSPGILPLMNHYKKINVDDKAAWLFTCKRDIFNKNVLNLFNSRQDDFVVVQNNLKEPIGIGRIEKSIVKNIIDIGDFLRREH